MRTSWSCFDSALNISFLILVGVQLLKLSSGGMEGTTMKGSLSRPMLDHRAYMIPAIRTGVKLSKDYGEYQALRSPEKVH